MKRPKGPELKLPDLKFPPFLVDLYWDLRDRRLLPLVVLAIVAIIAVPFLLAGGSEQQPAPVAVAPPNAAPVRSASELTVVRATPGLRDYRKRLRDRSPTDPFRQHYTAPDLSGSQLGSPGDNGFESSSTVTSTSTSTSTSSDSTTTKTTKTTKGADGATTKTETTTHGNGLPSDPEGGGGAVTLYSFAINVQITRTATNPDGTKDQGEPEVRKGVLPPSALPSEKAQVVTYMGISPKTRMPLLLVSDAVTAVFGEAKCLSGTETCQLLEVEPGFPMTFVYGPGGARYKINVLKVEPVTTGHS